MKRYILSGFHIISLVLLAMGLWFDILRIDITAAFFIDINLFNERRSVLGTLHALWHSGNYLPFLLILLFGILVPLIKSIIMFYLLLVPTAGNTGYKFVALSSKWAMADVFAISIFIAFLGAAAMKNTTAALEPGFYYFTAYVLISAVITAFFAKMRREAPANPA